MELGAEIEALLNRSKTRHIQSSEKGSFQRKVETFTFVTFAVFIIALIGFAAGNQGRYPDGTKDAAIEPVSAAEVVQSLPNNPAISDSSAELPPQTVSEQETVDPNSYQNFDTAKRVVGMCQGNENCLDQVRRWETAGYDATTVIRMILIFNKESGWQYDQVSTNTNGSKDVGFAQINTGYHCGKVGKPRNSQACIDALLDPDTNTRVAMELFDAQGWTPWVARKAYLPEFWADRVTL